MLRWLTASLSPSSRLADWYLDNLGSITLGILMGAAITSIIMGIVMAAGTFGVEPRTLQECLDAL